MRVALLVLAMIGLLSSGCASQQRRAPLCEMGFLKTHPPQTEVQPCEPCSPTVWQQMFAPSDEVRAARLRLAAAIIVVAGEIVFEIIKNN